MLFTTMICRQAQSTSTSDVPLALANRRRCTPSGGLPTVRTRQRHFQCTLRVYLLTYYTHAHPFNGPLSGTTQVSRYQKGKKPIWTLLKQETVSGSGISWAICKSAPRSREITTPVLHYSSFLQAGCPSCRPTNSVKALKDKQHYQQSGIITNKLPW